MADMRLTTAFGTVPLDAQDGIRRVIEDALAELAREGDGLRLARAALTESGERCVLTVELAGARRAPDPLLLDLAELEHAVTDRSAQARVTETLRGYFHRVLGR